MPDTLTRGYCWAHLMGVVRYDRCSFWVTMASWSLDTRLPSLSGPNTTQDTFSYVVQSRVRFQSPRVYDEILLWILTWAPHSVTSPQKYLSWHRFCHLMWPMPQRCLHHDLELLQSPLFLWAPVNADCLCDTGQMGEKILQVWDMLPPEF